MADSNFYEKKGNLEENNFLKEGYVPISNEKFDYGPFLKRENLNEKNEIQYYDVLTDRNFLWVHIDDLIKICKELRDDQLNDFYFKEDNDVVPGKLYIMVTEPFLKFVAENTNNPKYKPELVLLMLKERESDFDGLEAKTR